MQLSQEKEGISYCYHQVVQVLINFKIMNKEGIHLKKLLVNTVVNDGG